MMGLASPPGVTHTELPNIGSRVGKPRRTLNQRIVSWGAPIVGQRVATGALPTIVAAAADGAAVFETLLAEARNVRNAELSDQQAEAGVAGERLTLPAIVLAFGFIMLVLYPALTRF